MHLLTTDLTSEIVDYNHLFEQKISRLKAQGNYRYFLDIERSAAQFPVFHYSDAAGVRREALNFCSNDYLGQTTHPSVIAAAKHALDLCGAGSGGTRNISGSTTFHQILEQKTAELVGKERALIFNSAYLANQTALTTLGRHFKDAVFISDAENHASMIEGIRASKCEKLIFRHNDTRHLEEILLDLPIGQPKIVVFESVYSISGSIAPIADIVRIAKKYNALTYCDEVHAVGLYGKNGAGLVAECGCTEGVDLLNGTFAKAFGVVGGFLAGSDLLMDFIRSYAEGFIFTSSLPPATCSAVTESMAVLAQNPSIMRQMHQNVAHLRTLLQTGKINFDKTSSHITRLTIGSSRLCKQIADRLLLEFGIYIQPINFPTVPRGEECLRIIVSAKHTEAQMAQLVFALKNVLSM